MRGSPGLSRNAASQLSLAKRCVVVLLDEIHERWSVKLLRYRPDFAELRYAAEVFVHDILPARPDVVPEMSLSEREAIILVNIELDERIEASLVLCFIGGGVTAC